MSEKKIQSIKSSGTVPEFLPQFANLLSSRQTDVRSEADESPSNHVNDFSTVSSRKLVGVHVRDAWEFDSVEDVIYKASAVGGTALSFFFQYPREYNAKPVKIPDDTTGFLKACEKSGIKLQSIVPHGSYWLNPGSTDEIHLERTRVRMVDDVWKCHKLGIGLYNFHPGVLTGERSVEVFLQNVIETINYVHQETKDSNVILLLETAAGQGNEIGGKFEDLKQILDSVDNKIRVGICIDTCHIFSAGYDLRTKLAYEETMAKFDRIIGFENLKAVHLNDSKVPLGSRQDRHEVIGQGHIGLNAFRFLLNDSRFNGIPMVLETPRQKDDHLSEIFLLRSFEEESSGNVTASNKSYVEVDWEPTSISVEDICRLSEEIKSYYQMNIMDDAMLQTRNNIRSKLEHVLREHIDLGIHLAPIGGLINGLGTRNSDIDLSLILPPQSYGYEISWQNAVNTLRTSMKALKRGTKAKLWLAMNNDNNIVTQGARIYYPLPERGLDSIGKIEVRTGVIPILKLEIDGFNVDINCNDFPSVIDSHLLKYYVKSDWRFPAIVLIVKKWANYCGINDAKVGYLNNYTFVLMVVHFLQTRQDKPVLAKSGLTNVTDFRNLSFKDIEYELRSLDITIEAELGSFMTENVESVAELLMGFFEYFSSFQFDDYWISTKLGKRMSRKELPAGSEKYFIFIEDPFEEKNTARCVLHEEHYQKIINFFKYACDTLVSKPNLENLFSISL